MYLACFTQEKENNRVKCFLCPHECDIPVGRSGKCRVRLNQDGKLYSLNYGQVTAVNVDPIEKKPLYHFHPGKNILSLGTFGCNLHCDFCQNWQIAHKAKAGRKVSPQEIVEFARQYYLKEDSVGIAYTYSEPGMWYEFIQEVAPLIKEENLVNVLVTNGFMSKKPFKEMLKNIDALNIDVKSFSEGFYKKVAKGLLKPVLDNCILAKEAGCHLEITTLIIPGLNDDEAEIRELCKWIASVDKNIPLHLSRYYPNYKMEVKPTPLNTMLKAYEIASEYLNYVYVGNAPELNKSNTLCPTCGELLIKRTFYKTDVLYKDGKCSSCDNLLEGIIEQKM